MRFNDLEHAGTKTLPWLGGRRHSTELRDAESIAHVILDRGRKAQEITLG